MTSHCCSGAGMAFACCTGASMATPCCSGAGMASGPCCSDTGRTHVKNEDISISIAFNPIKYDVTK